MKFAIISDVHANLEGLQAVLDDADKRKCTNFAFLGDFVGYCANPEECVNLVRSLNAPCVQGNFDEYCATDLPLSNFAPHAAKDIQWTRNHLSHDNRQWLSSLPYVRTVDGFTIVHANLQQPERWGYMFEKTAAATSFTCQKTDVCFFGHTHVPIAFVRDTSIHGGSFTQFKVESGKKYTVNSGSVGQPRDGDPKAAYVIYNLAEQTIELFRVSYDVEACRRKIREAGLD